VQELAKAAEFSASEGACEDFAESRAVGGANS
jgi:hypothetical protein